MTEQCLLELTQCSRVAEAIEVMGFHGEVDLADETQAAARRRDEQASDGVVLLAQSGIYGYILEHGAWRVFAPAPG